MGNKLPILEDETRWMLKSSWFRRKKTGSWAGNESGSVTVQTEKTERSKIYFQKEDETKSNWSRINGEHCD